MKGTSKVIMGATLIMVLSLAIVLSLILVLLAELYCSLLVRRRRHPTTSLEGAYASEAPTQSENQSSSAPPPLSRFYSHGVLNAPRNFLFPSVSSKADDKVQQHSQLSQLVEASQPPQHTASAAVTVTALQVRILSSSPPSPNPAATESKLEAGEDANGSRSSKEHEHLVYISNPIFDDCIRATTPYVTPDTSPSRLGNTSGSSDEDENQDTSPITVTPPLSPMKELPAEACSVSLKDARCLNTSGSDSHSINGTSSSATPCTSPSW